MLPMSTSRGKTPSVWGRAVSAEDNVSRRRKGARFVMREFRMLEASLCLGRAILGQQLRQKNQSWLFNGASSGHERDYRGESCRNLDSLPREPFSLHCYLFLC